MANRPIGTDKTMKGASLISSTVAFFVEDLDYAVREGVAIGFTSGYESRANALEPWVGKAYPDQTLASCCLWSCPASNVGFRCVLGEEGRVRLYGPGGKPDREFQLPDAGVFRPGAAGYGYVNRIRTVGQSLYVCGAHRQVYRYVPGDRNPLSGRFVDVAGPMRQPPLPKPPQREGAAFEAWADLDVVQFKDIAGTAENDVYATGDETWHFDGGQWHRIELKVERETMHVIKVLEDRRILFGGSNGYLFMGNARQGFTNISHVDDNFTITGLESFGGQLFVATDRGLFTLDQPGHQLKPYRTGLQPELQDAHLLEAMDGVLWSFGYKDLAYLDTNAPQPQWVRVHHPDNPRIGEVQATQAASTVALAAASPSSPPAPALPDWLPAAPAQQGTLDVGGLMARVGHSGVGAFVTAQLAPHGLSAQQVLQVQGGKRYTVAVPRQGVVLTLQYRGPKRARPQPESHPEDWAVAEVMLRTRHADAHDHWRGPWPGGLDPYASDLEQRLQALWGEPDVQRDAQRSYFVDGSQGAAWVVNLEWAGRQNRLAHWRVLHLGGYLPWTN